MHNKRKRDGADLNLHLVLLEKGSHPPCEARPCPREEPLVAAESLSAFPSRALSITTPESLHERTCSNAYGSSSSASAIPELRDQIGARPQLPGRGHCSAEKGVRAC